KLDEIAVLQRMALTAEAVEPVLDVGGVARLAHLAVVDQIDPGAHLLAHDLGDRRSDARVERRWIDGHALFLGEHHPDEIGRARQAPRVRRQEPIGAAHVKLLSEVIMSDHTVTARYDTVFHHSYAVEQPELRRLYEQAKRDQWNVSRDIDWSRSVDLDSAVVADELIDIYGTPYWERLGPRERAELNRRFAAWRLSGLLLGGPGGMLRVKQ